MKAHSNAEKSAYDMPVWRGFQALILCSKVGEFDSPNTRRLSCHSTTPGTSRNSPLLIVSDTNIATSGDTTHPFDDGKVMCTRLVQLVARNSSMRVPTNTGLDLCYGCGGEAKSDRGGPARQTELEIRDPHEPNCNHALESKWKRLTKTDHPKK